MHDASLRIIVELSDGSEAIAVQTQVAEVNAAKAKAQKMNTEQDRPIGGYLMEATFMPMRLRVHKHT